MVGILALHGNVSEHRAVLDALGIEHCDVRTPADLKRCDRLIIPGGESTVMARFLDRNHLREPLAERIRGGMPILGICAGAILLAKEVTGHRPPQSLNGIDITVERNAYGSQLDSFDEMIHADAVGGMRCAFIRAPKITRIGSGVTVLAKHNSEPVIVRQGAVIAATCHPEQRGETALHRWFAQLPAPAVS